MAARRQRASLAGMVALLALAIALRVLWPQSDAYARLSWSSALVTDEGFYCHHARSLVLFGHPPADQFDNALIMPLLHGVQVLTFRLFGVGLVQARGISIGCSLLTLALFFAACRRAFGTRVAAVALLLLALDHVNLLYNRLALMDTPAQLPLVAAFYAFVRGQGAGSREQGRNLTQRRRDAERGDREQGRRGEGSHRGTKAQRDTRKEGSDAFLFSRWSVVCGVCLIAAYAVRGLSALLAPVPLLILWQEARREVSRRDAETPREGTGKRASSLASFSFSSVAASLRFCVRLLPGPLLVGLAVGGGVYLLAWYLPHHAELSRVNRYYLWHQLLPTSPKALLGDVAEALFGAERGMVSYLLRHTPVQFILMVCWMIAWRRQSNSIQNLQSKIQNPEACLFLMRWAGLFFTTFALLRYAPSRYYVLVYPPLAALVALALTHWPEVLKAAWEWTTGRVVLAGLLAYHVALLISEQPHGLTPLSRIAFAAVCGILVLVMLLRWHLPSLPERWFVPANAPQGFAVLLALWAAINVGWLADWMGHIEYTQRDAERWLAQRLPANSVLIGDPAPGLALYNRWEAIPVIPGLCNDNRPLERYAGRPRYVFLFSGPTPRRWWQNHYPQVVAPNNLAHTFRLLGRFNVDLYPVQN